MTAAAWAWAAVTVAILVWLPALFLLGNYFIFDGDVSWNALGEYYRNAGIGVLVVLLILAVLFGIVVGYAVLWKAVFHLMGGD
jgi:hypothetical protein